ncbi:hypothetical protein BT96DRAFT_962947 [Gymnopus androsaceus JB14]|uniref:SMP-30/Gluconolactonase/LRE-like region domain-containing protein n=1 Tax=Gymnopus androsaceus JB14 TaxID=1447944 RepID=A0A6A4I765_9AGAR|nr:hypothetical protein BT96DRAFT_962947 [Gymnopus androsaceus JB14]
MISTASAKNSSSFSPSAKQSLLTANEVTIHTFPNGTALENLAIRANGQVLTTVSTSPDLYLFNPVVDSAPVTLVHTFPGYSSLLGIVEVQPDQFYVVAGNFSWATLSSTPGSFSIFHVDMAQFPYSINVTKTADFPEGGLLNGLCLFSKEEGLIYVADSFAGVVSLLQVDTGVHYVAVNLTLTNGVNGTSGIEAIGVNGVHVFQPPTTNGTATKYLYFSNTARALLARVPIDDTGAAVGETEVLASDLIMDDFTLDDEGNVFQAVFGSNEVVRIDAVTGNVTVLAGNVNSTELRAATSVQFGRTESEKGIAYVTTNGGVDETMQVGGALKMIELGILA